MVKMICRDVLLMRLPSQPATEADKAVITDLKDTLAANSDRCVGMAANMIGVRKRILAFGTPPVIVAMVNPKITKREGKYNAEEGCLSFDGVRPVERWKTIEVEYLDEHFKPQKRRFTDFTAQIIQHEMDHFEGKIV